MEPTISYATMSHPTSMFDRDDDFWKTYLKGRATPPDAFFQLIFDYHKQHGGRFRTLHECGAGAGVHSARIGAPFERIILSDPAEQNIRAARERLKVHNNITFHTAKAEDGEWMSPESVDLLFAANCIHFADLNQLLEAVKHQLKPGGTFAVALFGIPAILDGKAQDIWCRMWQKGFESTNFGIERVSVEQRAWITTCSIAASWETGVPLPETIFKPGAIRYKLNVPQGWSWYRMVVAPSRDKEVPHLDETGPRDIVLEERQPGWHLTLSLTDLQDIAATFPIWGDGREFEGFWKDIEAEMKNGSLDAVYPAAVMLATKK